MNIPGCDLFGRKTLESVLFPADSVVNPVIDDKGVFCDALLRPLSIIPRADPTFAEVYSGTTDFYGSPEGPVPECIEDAAVLGALAAKVSLSYFRG